MKITEIKRLCEDYTVGELDKAEQQLLEGESLSILVNGVDEGEQLTHINAAQWCLKEMKKSNKDFKSVIREFTDRVRKSIS